VFGLEGPWSGERYLKLWLRPAVKTSLHSRRHDRFLAIWANGSGKSNDRKNCHAAARAHYGEDDLRSSETIHKNLSRIERPRDRLRPQGKPNLYPFLTGGGKLRHDWNAAREPQPRKSTRISSSWSFVAPTSSAHVTIVATRFQPFATPEKATFYCSLPPQTQIYLCRSVRARCSCKREGCVEVHVKTLDTSA